MSDRYPCPRNPDPLTCGINAAEYLVETDQIELSDPNCEPEVGRFGNLILDEVLIWRYGNSDEESREAYLQCAKCLGKIIVIIDGPDGLESCLAGEIPPLLG